MTWLLHTSSRAKAPCPTAKTLLAVLLATVPLMAGPINGRVELKDSKDAAVRKGMDFSGVVIWLERANAGVTAAPEPIKTRMVQKNKTFTPHVLPVTVGSLIDFPNFDPIFHNAFSNYNGQLFDLGLYAPGSSRSVRFSTAGVVRVFCNIHAAMSAVIVVLNTPYFATSQKDGTFRIANVPAGSYTLHVFHERASEKTLSQSTRIVTVTTEPLSLAAISISESGYLAIPHSNKYGHDYQAAPDEGGVYPAVRK
jgi:plastocyanin